MVRDSICTCYATEYVHLNSIKMEETFKIIEEWPCSLTFLYYTYVHTHIYDERQINMFYIYIKKLKFFILKSVMTSEIRFVSKKEFPIKLWNVLTFISKAVLISLLCRHWVFGFPSRKYNDANWKVKSEEREKKPMVCITNCCLLW